MWLFRRKVGGLIGALGLSDWWFSLTDQERATIRMACDPENRFLVRGSPNMQHLKRPLNVLTGIANLLNRPATRELARKILVAAEQFVGGAPVLDRHFFYQVVIEANYPDRERDPGALAKAIWACEQQIALAPLAAEEFRHWPRHHLEQLRQAFGDAYVKSWAEEHKEELEREYPLPVHVGYTQLAIILEKQGRYEDAIRLCEQAMQQGWAGEWERRIARLRRKQKR